MTKRIERRAQQKERRRGGERDRKGSDDGGGGGVGGCFSQDRRGGCEMRDMSEDNEDSEDKASGGGESRGVRWQRRTRAEGGRRGSICSKSEGW